MIIARIKWCVMVQEVRITNQIDPVPLAMRTFFGLITLTAVVVAGVMIWTGIHIGIAAVTGVVMLGGFSYLCRKYRSFVWGVGIVQAAILAVALIYLGTIFADWIWGVIAAAVGVFVMISATRVVAREL